MSFGVLGAPRQRPTTGAPIALSSSILNSKSNVRPLDVELSAGLKSRDNFDWRKAVTLQLIDKRFVSRSRLRFLH